MEKGSYHLIGLGGIGMSGLARILLERGFKVSGSDARSSALLESLAKMGAKVFIGHKASQVPKGAVVVYSSGIEETNSEYMQAKAENELIHRSKMLSELMKGSLPLLVTGTHGKTTTSSLLAHVLVFAEENPSYCIGGVVKSLRSGSGHGKGEWFVAEADESDGSFLAYVAKGAIITNIGIDHLSYWKSEEKLIEGFKEFQKRVLDKDLLFYLRSRGLSKKNSLSLLIKSFFHKIISEVHDKSFVEKFNYHSNVWLKENNI